MNLLKPFLVPANCAFYLLILSFLSSVRLRRMQLKNDFISKQKPWFSVANKKFK